MNFAAKLATLRAPKPTTVETPRALADISSLVPARPGPFGPVHARELVFPATERPCMESLSALCLAPELRGVDSERVLFLDTETTGLAGGTGTLAFLIGTAFFRDGQLVVQQLHLPAPGRERPMLQHVSEQLSRASALITFNGKSFDWPLLKNRFVMNRLPVPERLPHVDLLHAARRVFRFHLQETRLTTLETQVLGLRRQGDIDGALIPQAWFDFLRTGRLGTLARVLDHNAQDVKSMVDVLQVLTRAWKAELEVTPSVALGLATVAFRQDDADPQTLSFCAQAQRAEGAIRALAFELEAAVHRKRRDVRLAVKALEASLLSHEEPARIHLALAKLYEHRVKDFGAARRHAAKAGPAEDVSSHMKRRDRLERHLQLSLET